MPYDIQKLIDRLKAVATVEQVEMIVDALQRAQGRAVDRRCVQSVEVVFNEKGFLRFVNTSDSVFVPAPGAKMYNAE